jgi:hypothetical protein
MSRILARVAVAALMLVATASGSWAAEWMVAQFSGTVWIVAPDASAAAPVVGDEVRSGWTVATGPNSRILLVNGDETMAVGPETTMVFWSVGRSTLVREQEGTITFEVDQRNVRNFSVQTPILAAVVKGTGFTVSTSAVSAGVAVEHGSVEVHAFVSGQVATIVGGQRATVGVANPQLILAGVGQLPPIVQGYARRSVPSVPDGVAVPGAAAMPVIEPAEEDPCKNGGWMELGFLNQGACISTGLGGL